MVLDMPLVIRGQSGDERDFQEETFTLAVNAHGALLLLATGVALGQRLTLINPKNWDEREARVAYLGPAHVGLAKVGIEFTRPAPEFWSVSSPPGDWNAS